jgi:hypothetical protein
VANHVERSVYGPFHRVLAPGVQDADTVVKQMLSGEIWGLPPSWGGSPAVKAFAGSLPEGASGVEFWAFQPPDVPYGPRSYWRSAGKYLTVDLELVLFKLRVAFVRITQDLHPQP